MENASKALLIAGAVLISMLVATFGIYFGRKVAAPTSEIYKTLEQSDIDEINQKFFEFEGRDIYIQDVVSIVNLTKNINKSGKVPAYINTDIPPNLTEPFEFRDEENNIIPNEEVATNAEKYLNNDIINQIISTHLENKYVCTLSFGNKSQFIEKVIITESST